MPTKSAPPFTPTRCEATRCLRTWVGCLMVEKEKRTRWGAICASFGTELLQTLSPRNCPLRLDEVPIWQVERAFEMHKGSGPLCADRAKPGSDDPARNQERVAAAGVVESRRRHELYPVAPCVKRICRSRA